MKRIIPLLIIVVLSVAACASPAVGVTESVMESTVDLMDENEEQEPESNDEMMDTATVVLPAWYDWSLTEVTTGEVFKINDFQGKVVLVETMAVWCSNCFKQQNEVVRLLSLQDMQDDLVSLGINIDPNEDAALLGNYVQKNGFDWLYTVASPELIGEISTLYGPQFLNPPSSPMFVIDKQGEAHLLPFGTKSAEELRIFLQPFLDETG